MHQRENLKQNRDNVIYRWVVLVNKKVNKYNWLYTQSNFVLNLKL